jgi:hypothetical protein
MSQDGIFDGFVTSPENESHHAVHPIQAIQNQVGE